MAYYLGCWSDLDGVCADFNVSKESLGNINILLAAYSQECYEGYAFVLFERDGKLYEVHGSHCSCYGLEDQWNEEESSVESIEHRLNNGNLGFYMGEHEAEVLNALRSML